MRKSHKIAILGTGFIADFYTATLHSQRTLDRVHTVYSRSIDKGNRFKEKWSISNCTNNMHTAIHDNDIDTVIIGLPNHLHKDAVLAAAEAGKSILCTKPLGRTSKEALEMLDAVEKKGIFNGYLEDLVYPPKTLKAIHSVKDGSIGKVMWARSRETHPGPHSDWFWDNDLAGGGAIIDMGCHCVEIIRNFIGKGIRPVEAMCWSDTLVHPIEGEDHGIGLIRFENGAIGQFEVSWAFRGGMDLRDEISGTEGTIWLNHWLRTGFEMFTSGSKGGYVAEKAEGDSGWLFPVGDEAAELGYTHMFNDMFEAMDNEEEPMETFYDGYIVNTIIDACYKSAQTKQWEPINISLWRGEENVSHLRDTKEIDGHILIKTEVMPDGTTKQILKDPETGKISERYI
ncbi:MAG: Gfo/Idh/MocA family oxidoreductase [Candidatus Neomarinimicrobiota bacterium]|nr:Gfo/Idh/MocA family oxidoreductase [Candidatus Neomarinimicrobiota bacterium]MEC9273831.1 Gfo/Idh/MocA family oxidoreductase [Candidatus Neomarinimicrobiota bacterium]MEE3195958.1 Gfo/Idh/MocA family oxidoreductase [Candidatus Neomarinimicrobiota bacterium]